jgi:hypothetical protein
MTLVSFTRRHRVRRGRRSGLYQVRDFEGGRSEHVVYESVLKIVQPVFGLSCFLAIGLCFTVYRFLSMTGFFMYRAFNDKTRIEIGHG